jgi:tetratricopeptide (TPR) repeat protein/DNA-binding CsgD family transcriptional regulator
MFFIKRSALILFCFVCFENIFSQENILMDYSELFYKDSVLLNKKSIDGLYKIEKNNLITSNYSYFNIFKKQFLFLNENKKYDAALKLSFIFLKSDIKPSEVSEVYLMLAGLYYKLDNYSLVYSYLDKIENNLKDSRRFALYERIGVIFSDINEDKKAFSVLNKAYQFAKSNNDENYLIRILSSLGNLNNSNKNFDLALDYYNKSLALSTKLKDYKSMAAAYNNITTIEIKNKDYDKALKTLLNSKFLLDKTGSDEQTRYSIDYNIASVYVSLKKSNDAREIIDDVKAYTLKNNIDLLYVYCLITEADLFELEGSVSKSILTLNKAILIAEKLKNTNLQSEIYLRLSSFYENSGNLNKALFNFKKHKETNDILNDEIKFDDIKTLQAKYNIAEYKKNLEIQSQKNEFLEIQSRKTKYIFSLLVLLIIVLLYLAYRQFKTILLKKKNEIYLSEINGLKELNLKNEVEFKNKQVTEFAIQIQEQNRLLLNLKKDLSSINVKSKEDTLKNIKNTTHTINSHIKLNNEKVLLNANIEETYENFLINLNNKYPDLNKKEIKICTLIKLNFNTKEIAEQLGIAEHSIHNYRYSIRKKLKIDKSIQLDEYILNS